MGKVYEYVCNICKLITRTSGPWEYYFDVEQQRKFYGHPGPKNIEAEKRGIHGFSGHLYCQACKEVIETVLIEFEKPIFSSKSAWEEIDAKKFSREPIECPRCKAFGLILEPIDDRKINCRRCKKGELIFHRILS